jgi:hypothetical protein
MEANIETQLLKFFELQVERLDKAKEGHETEYDEQKKIIENQEEKKIAEIKELMFFSHTFWTYKQATFPTVMTICLLYMNRTPDGV